MLSHVSTCSGKGAISSNNVNLATTPPFESNPPNFALTGVTRGGPPTAYTWTRNGEVITDGGPYNISIAVTVDNQTNRIAAGYTSTLVVTGDLPGVYQYSVSNRAMTSSVDDTFAIQGIVNTRGIHSGEVGLGISAESPF